MTAATVEDAAEAFAPWIRLTPDVPEGVLGWLADRTTMTPALTRIVLTAHAPRRRLSHLLDTTGPITPLRQIPQVLPEPIYQDHLAALFTSTPDTVRLFASLALARTHPDVTTWADAATSLGLPAELGITTARTCSASLIAAPAAVVIAIVAATAELGGTDYRAVEDRIRRLARTSRWYTTWARTHRPRSRATSQPYAVAWLWTRIGHGDLSSSPGWLSPPSSEQRARARHFTGSLTPPQQDALAGVITPAPQEEPPQ